MEITRHSVSVHCVSLVQTFLRIAPFMRVRDSFLSNVSVYESVFSEMGFLSYVLFKLAKNVAGNNRDYMSLKDTVPSLVPPVTETKDIDDGNQRKLMVGELVWGAARGSPAWPGKVESLGPAGTVWVRWYGGGGSRTQVDVKALKSLSEGLEAHHRARKKFRK